MQPHPDHWRSIAETVEFLTEEELLGIAMSGGWCLVVVAMARHSAGPSGS